MTRRPPMPPDGNIRRAHQRMAPGGRLWSESPVKGPAVRVVAAGDDPLSPIIPTAGSNDYAYGWGTVTSLNLDHSATDGTGMSMVLLVHWYAGATVGLPGDFTEVTTGSVGDMSWAVLTKEFPSTSPSASVSIAEGDRAVATSLTFGDVAGATLAVDAAGYSGDLTVPLYDGSSKPDGTWAMWASFIDLDYDSELDPDGYSGSDPSIWCPWFVHSYSPLASEWGWLCSDLGETPGFPPLAVDVVRSASSDSPVLTAVLDMGWWT